jgi:hypothetical protein
VRPSRRAVAKPSAASAGSTRSRKLVNWLNTTTAQRQVERH